MSSRPCRFFLVGNCRNGSRCHFYHEGFSSLPREFLIEDEEEGEEEVVIVEEDIQEEDEEVEEEEEVSISPGHRTEIGSANPSSNPTRPAYAATRPCHWYMNGYCLRGDNCWFSHDRSIINGTRQSIDPNQDNETNYTGQSEPNNEEDEEDQKCAICFEVPKTFGLLVSCNHAFCLTCIRTWRSKETTADFQPYDSSNTSVTKACPNCRTQSLYIVPSSFFPSTPEEKEVIIQKYKEVTARKACKYFAESGERHWCPFGDDCFFAHLDENGEKIKVNPGSDPRRRRDSIQRRLAHSRRTLLGMRREILYTLRPSANPTEEDLIGLQSLLEQLSHFSSTFGSSWEEDAVRPRPRNSRRNRRNRRNQDDYPNLLLENIILDQIDGLAQLDDSDYEFDYGDNDDLDFHETWSPHDL